MALHLRQARRGQILQGLAASRAMSIPCGRPRISRARTGKAKDELAAGKGVREAARSAGISAASASRIKAVVELGGRERLTHRAKVAKKMKIR